MDAPIEYYLIAGGMLLILSVLSSKATDRLGIPSLLVFLALGMLAGSEGIGGIYFDNASLSQALGVVALTYILFSGGLETEFRHVRPIIREGAILASLGVFLTCIFTGIFAAKVLGFSTLEGLLLGAIVSSTDAAAVFTVLRARSVNLKGKVKPLLELESGLNDPMAVLLTVGLLQLMGQGDVSPYTLIPLFFTQLAVGGIAGYVVGKTTGILLNRLKLEFDGLYPVVTIALVVLVYGFTQAIGGNGFLAVYLTGLMLGKENFIHKKSLVLFHGGIAWLMQIAMFLTLGLLVFPSSLLPVAPHGMAVSVFLILIARPAAVFLSLVGSSFTIREKALIAWVGLRGSVPIILATYPLLAGISRADVIFHLVFFIVITSVLIQGTSISAIAKLLKVDAPVRAKFRYPIEYVPTGNVKNDLVEMEVRPNSPAIGKSIIELNLPKDALIVLIQRKGNVIVPKGGTHLEADDTMLVLADKDALNAARKILEQMPA